MIDSSIKRLKYLCDLIPPLIKNLSDEKVSTRPHSDKWSKKEILGHLLDSATNNHHRFIRAQFEDVVFGRYHQTEWVTHNHYSELSISHLIAFWEAYNRHLLEVIKRIPEEKLLKVVNVAGEEHTLEWIIQDYIDHMEHHLAQIVEYA